MPNKKRQRYIPQFYLRNFSAHHKRKTIGLWNIRTEKHIPHAPLKNQAYKPYLYGEDLAIENALSDVETYAADAIRNTIKTTSLPKKNTPERLIVLTFIVAQMNRTISSADDVESNIDQLMKAAYRNAPTIGKHINDFEFGMENSAAFRLSIGIKYVPVLMDLKWELLLNKTTRQFITSDNPVVRYNQFIEKKRWPGSRIGIAQPGLQIFFPLSPYTMLFLYDGDIYKATHSNRSIIHVIKTADVNRLNGLQILYSKENLYFNDNIKSEYVLCLQKRWSKYRKPRVNVAEFVQEGTIENKPPKSSLLVSTQEDMRMGLEFSFIKFTARSRKREMGPTMWNPRNKEVEKTLTIVEDYIIKENAKR